MSLNKQELRRRAKELYVSLEEGYMNSADEAIARHLTELNEYKNARCILFYYSVGREVKTLSLIENAISDSKTVCLPLSRANGIMTAKRVFGLADLSGSRYGIPAPADIAPDIEPDEIDLIVVPALAFDREGNRLGHGGGYYDRYLKTTNAFSVGLIREKLIFKNIPTDIYDVHVRCLITETGTRRYI